MQFLKRISPQVQNVIKRVSALAVMIVITVSSVITVAASTCNALVEYNGEKKNVQLMSSSTEDILKAAGVETHPSDQVTRKETGTDGEITIVVRSGYRVTVKADGKTAAAQVHYGDTVAKALSTAGITLKANDQVEPSASELVSDGLQIAVKRQYNVAVTADGKTQSVLVPEGTVGQALSQANVTLDEDDLVTPAKETAVTENMNIKVSRVTFQEVTTVQPIAYSHTTVNDASLYQGEKKIKTPGKNGSKTVVTRQKLVDGKLVSSEVASTSVTAQPVAQVTSVGTKKRPAAVAKIRGDGTVVDHLGNTIRYKQCFTGKCTAYSGGGRTSTGRAVSFGMVAVNPNIIPYGSRLYICSTDGKTVYGYATAADTGTGVMKGRILADLYYPTSSKCKSFGVRNMNIYVLS